MGAWAHLARNHRYHAAIVVLDDRYARLPESINPYLHSKAFLLANGIPVQGIRIQTLRQREAGIAYTLRNISVALYAKMNGLPWTIDHVKSFDHEIVFGLGVTEISGSRSILRQRFVGITTVFQGDGSYLLGATSRKNRPTKDTQPS